MTFLYAMSDFHMSSNWPNIDWSQNCTFCDAVTMDIECCWKTPVVFLFTFILVFKTTSPVLLKEWRMKTML